LKEPKSLPVGLTICYIVFPLFYKKKASLTPHYNNTLPSIAKVNKHPHLPLFQISPYPPFRFQRRTRPWRSRGSRRSRTRRSSPPSPPATSAIPSPGLLFCFCFYFYSCRMSHLIIVVVVSCGCPRFRMPANSIPKEAAYQIINDELMLDGNPRLNLASFVTTWMEPECDKLIMASVNKNYVDMDEYPVTTELQVHHALFLFDEMMPSLASKSTVTPNPVDPTHPLMIPASNRCVNMIAHLFNAPLGESEAAVGVGTVGSSEAIMLAGLAFKRKWQNKRKAEGKPCDKPNIVTGANVQVCWEKFARYFEVELKEVKLRDGYYVMDPHKAVDMVDENTICVAAILGSTLNGEFEDVKLLNDLLTQKNKETG
ncbi:hypothetical protein GW17_00026760, partial [Ensete ventricosum]